MSVYALLVVAIIGINVYFNVYGLFYNEQFSYRIITNDRMAKLMCLENAKEKPECYVMGSSNSMRFRPDSLTSITGLKSFNLGMFHARIEDYWCMSNAIIHNLEKSPKLIMFCLDDWNFADEPAPNDEIFEGAEKRLAYKPDLSQYLDDFSELKLIWGKLKTALTYESLKGSINCFLEIVKTGNTEKAIVQMDKAFYPNGTRKKYGRIDFEDVDITDTCETGTFDVTAYLRQVDTEWKKHPTTKNGILDKSHSKFESFSMRRLQLFERTIDLLENNDCKVILNIMPNQPYFKEIIERETNYPERLDYLIQYCSYLQVLHPNIIAIQDNSDIKNFNGHANHFFDYMHPTFINSDLMIETFREKLEQHAF